MSMRRHHGVVCLLGNYFFTRRHAVNVRIYVYFFSPRYYVEFDRDRYLGGLTVDAEGKVIAAKAAKMIWYFSANTTVSPSSQAKGSKSTLFLT